MTVSLLATNENFLSAGALRLLGCGILLATTIVASSACAAHSEEAPLKVFILAGQSNMRGRGTSAELPPELRRQKDVLCFAQGAWTPLESGKSFGPEVTFGQAMAQHFHQPIGVIKLAIDGSNLAVQWSPDNPNSFYARLLGDVKEARKSRRVVIAAMLWMQGAADAKTKEMAQAYQSNLTHLIEAARKDFDAPSLPFVCGRMSPHPMPYTDLVRKAQESIKLSNYRMVNCDDLTMRGGHYDTQGQENLGKRFAAAMIDLLNPPKAQGKAP